MRKLLSHFMVLLAVCVIGTTARAEGQKRPSSAVYPVGDRLVRLGWDGVTQDAIKHAPADYAWVNAPESVVRAGKHFLVGDPQDWRVEKDPNFGGEREWDPGPEVVFLVDRRFHSLVFLVGEKEWIRLNDRAGLPALNELLKRYPGRDVFHADKDKVARYVQDVAQLHGGYCRMFLSQYYLNGARQSKGDPWLRGTEKRPEALYELCHDPICRRHGRTIQVKYNVFIFGGGVEQWTLRGVWRQGLVIRQIDVRLIRKLGTFDFGGL